MKNKPHSLECLHGFFKDDYGSDWKEMVWAFLLSDTFEIHSTEKVFRLPPIQSGVLEECNITPETNRIICLGCFSTAFASRAALNSTFWEQAVTFWWAASEKRSFSGLDCCYHENHWPAVFLRVCWWKAAVVCSLFGGCLFIRVLKEFEDKWGWPICVCFAHLYYTE